MSSLFDKAKDSALEAGLPEREAAAYATEFIQVLGVEEAAERLNCECGLCALLRKWSPDNE